jgi:hypothetical protein
MDQKYAVVVQAVRFNSLTNRSTTYVLGVKLAKTKDMADKKAEELQKQGYVTDVVLADPLPDLV